MVQRSFVVKRVKFDRKGRSEEEIRLKIDSLFGNLATVIVTEDKIIVEGDLHDHRKRKPLLDYLAGD